MQSLVLPLLLRLPIENTVSMGVLSGLSLFPTPFIPEPLYLLRYSKNHEKYVR